MKSLRTHLLIGSLFPVFLLTLLMFNSIYDFSRIAHSFDRGLARRTALIEAAEGMRSAAALERTGLDLARTKAKEEGLLDLEAGQKAFNDQLRRAQQNALSQFDQDDLKLLGKTHEEAEGHMRLLVNPHEPDVPLNVVYNTARSLGSIDRVCSAVITRNQTSIFTESSIAQRLTDRALIVSIAAAAAALIMALLFSRRNLALTMNPLQTLVGRINRLGGAPANLSPDGSLGDRVVSEFQQASDSLTALEHRLDEARRLEAERLERVKRMADEAVRSLSEPVITTDSEGFILMMNGAAEVLFGAYDGASPVHFTSAVSSTPIIDALAAALQDEPADEQSKGADVTLDTDGRQMVYSIHASSIRTDGRIIGAVLVLEDITALREIDEMKNNFIASASHELRTPVTSLLLSAELLLEDSSPSTTPRQTSLIRSQIDDLGRLQKFINDLLEVSRLTHGTIPLDLAEFNVKDLVEESVQAVTMIAEHGGVIIEQNAENFTLKGDRGQLLRVLINLLENAIRYTPTGKKVVVRAQPIDNEVRFSIEDEGSGIPGEHLKHVFERFVQVPGTSTGGAGLGLSIAKSIVEAHGGTIAAQSQTGVGSIFTFSIPFA